MRKSFFLIYSLIALSLISIASANLATDTVLYWTFDTNSSPTTADSTPNGNDGTLTNVDWLSSGCVIGGCYDFNSASDNISITSLLDVSIQNNLSISGWVYIGNTGNMYQGFGFGDFNVLGNGFNVRATTSAGSQAIVSNSGAAYNSKISALSTGAWYHVVLTAAGNTGTTYKYYVNGVDQGAFSTSGGGATLSGIVHDFLIINYPDSFWFTGRWDEIGVFDTTLTQAQVNTLYNSGAGEQYPFGASTGTNATLTASNDYNSTSIDEFNATINGTTYTTTNGTIVLDIQTNSTELYNITFAATDFYSIQYNNINLSTTYDGELRQASAQFFAYNRVSNASVTTFTASTTSNGGSASNTDTNPFFYLAAGTYDFQFDKTGYYQSFIEDAVINALTSSDQNFSVYDHKLNVTITSGGSAGSTNFSANIYSLDYNYTEQASTTSGEIIFNVTNGNYTVWINDSTHSLQDANITLNSSDNFTSLNIDVRTSNTFNISFYNETTNEILNTTTVTWEIISVDEVRNGTTTNGTVYEELLTPGNYEIIYYYDVDVPRSYFVTLTNQSSETMRLYTIDEDISSFYLPVAEDQNGEACVNQTVGLLRYYIDINGYRVVEMAKTSTTGQAVLRVEPNIINYKLQFQGTCGDFTTEPAKLVSQSDTYTVSDSQGFLTSLTEIEGVSTSFTFNNATDTFTFTWADNQNLITQACLVCEIKYLNGTIEEVNNECTEGGSGSLIYTATDTNNTAYSCTRYLYTNTQFSTYTDTLSYDFRRAFENFGLIGVLMTLLLVIGFALMGLGSGEAVVIGAGIALLISAVAGFIYTPWVAGAGLAIVIVIIMYKSRT